MDTSDLISWAHFAASGGIGGCVAVQRPSTVVEVGKEDQDEYLDFVKVSIRLLSTV